MKKSAKPIAHCYTPSSDHREEVRVFLTQQMSVKDIAYELRISEWDVVKHIEAIRCVSSKDE